jgi:hypothetical protein
MFFIRALLIKQAAPGILFTQIIPRAASTSIQQGVSSRQSLCDRMRPNLHQGLLKEDHTANRK